MTQEHLIRPPHELVQQWVSLACENEGYETWQDLATEAARWGADQELDACCEWLKGTAHVGIDFELINARRPKPPSLKEQALEDLDSLIADLANHGMGFKATNIRRALEQLPDNE
jgi:hypothetical protein